MDIFIKRLFNLDSVFSPSHMCIVGRGVLFAILETANCTVHPRPWMFVIFGTWTPFSSRSDMSKFGFGLTV